MVILFVLNANAQKKELQDHLLETYKTSEEFLKDSASLKHIYQITTIEKNYIHVRRKLNPKTKKKDKGRYYGFKYNGKKYYSMLWSESSNQYLYVPVDVEGFFSLILMPRGKVNSSMPSLYSMGAIGAVLMQNQAQSIWKDKAGNQFYIMILEPNIKGSAYYTYSSLSDKKIFGVYMGKASIKRYNRKFGFNLEKRGTKVEDWIDVVNHLNTLHDEGKLDYSLKQKEAIAREKIKMEARDKIIPYSEKKQKEYVPYSQRSNK